ncbi:MAG: hypothetical protein WCS85_02405 [Candidatus Peribacteraceae bacterium]|jgi:hypothetical protein
MNYHDPEQAAAWLVEQGFVEQGALDSLRQAQTRRHLMELSLPVWDGIVAVMQRRRVRERVDFPGVQQRYAAYTDAIERDFPLEESKGPIVL